MKKSPSANPWIRLISDLVDYGPIVITVIAAIIFSIQANSPNHQTGDVLQWMLLLLTFLATTMLVDRFRFMRKLDTKVTGLEETVLALKTGEIEVLDEIPDLRERIQRARSVSLSGLTLNRTSMEYRSILRERANSGAQIRVLILDPEDEPLLATTAIICQQPYDEF